MFFKKKGQGALEYLLLIGGAVLIAVIVIALLVGMGGQSRETAQDQATKAQQALEQPQPATIVSLSANSCDSATYAELSMDWQKLGEGGTYKFTLYDYSNGKMALGPDAATAQGAAAVTELEITGDTTATIFVGMNNKACADTYWGEITTTKNGQDVKSTRMKINME